MIPYQRFANPVDGVWKCEHEECPPPDPHEPLFVQRMRELQRIKPDYVEHEAWEQAVDDGFRFAVDWLSTAEDLGWTVDDLAGLPAVPEKPHPTYRRLSKYDDVGLIWCLRGRPVKAITANTAAIGTSGGGQVTFYKRL